MSAATPSPGSEVDTWKTIPNLITALRILLILPFSYYVAHGNDANALIIFFIAGISDTFDGVLARWLKQSSRIGRLVDPIADKFLAGIAYLMMSLFRDGRTAIPVWLMVMVIARDVLILFGSWVVYRVAHSTAFKPTLAGKLNTLIELLVIGWFLTGTIFPVVAPALPVLYWLTAASIVISFAGYVRQGMAMMGKRVPT